MHRGDLLKKRMFCVPIFILTLILLLQLCSCNHDTNNTNDSDTLPAESSASEDVTATSPQNSELIIDGKSKFVIVSSRNQSSENPKALLVSNFYLSMCALSSATPGTKDAPAFKIDEDFIRSQYEDTTIISIGLTDVEESKQVYSEINFNDYGYKVINGHIVIYGYTTYLLQKAANDFATVMNRHMTINENKNTELILEADFGKNYTAKNNWTELPKVDFGSNITVCDDGDDALLIVSSKCSEDDYKGYLKKLSDSGFSEFSKNEIKGNLFSTYTKNDLTVDAWFTPEDSTVRVTIQQGFDNISPAKTEYTKICDSGLTLIGSPSDDTGMCLLFKLEDGRFVVIDGGSRWPSSKMDQRLYEQLKNQAEDASNIVIACWILTHSHQDHIAAFQGFANNFKDVYSSTVTIESVMFNFAGDDQASVTTQQLSGSDNEIRSIVKSAFADSKLFKPHPGNEISFANMRIEVLGTHESYIFKNYPEDYNACCLFLKITINDQVICIPADTDATNNKVIEQIYGEYLKCDILQVDHHGGFGGVSSTNKLFAPEVLIFFTNNTNYLKYQTSSYNQTLLNNANFKQSILVDQNIIYLPLPYVSGTDTIIK